MSRLPDRERDAQREMAASRIGRSAARLLVSSLLATLAVGGAIEALKVARGTSRVHPGEPPIPGANRLSALAAERGLTAANRELRLALAAFEDRSGRESALSGALRPAAQWLLVRALSYGNSQVVVARDGFLYFQTAFEHLTGPPFLAPSELERRRAAVAPSSRFEPDPVPGLAKLALDLEERGIRLLFLPVPVKAQIHPEPLLRGAALRVPTIENPSMPELARRLEAAGVALYDPAAELRAAALAGEMVYLPTDTHWNPLGMRIVARGVARTLRERGWIEEALPLGLERHATPRDFPGEMVALLGLGPRAARIAPERVVLDEVTALGGAPLSGLDAPRELLVLGDSYSAIFAEPGRLGSAGFADQLAYELDRPVRSLAKMAANDLPGRVRWLRDDPALLAGVRIVVYEATARALSTTDWSATPITPQRTKRRKNR
jgi:hypothetical protein